MVIGVIEGARPASPRDEDIGFYLVEIVPVEVIHLVAREPLFDELAPHLFQAQGLLRVGFLFPFCPEIEEQSPIGEFFRGVVADGERFLKEIDHLFRQHIARITPPTVRSTVRTSFGAKPIIINRHHPAIRAAAKAYYKGFGAMPVSLRSGGTIPVINIFQDVLGIPTVLMGLGLPDDRIHAPNEKFYLPNFYNGITTCIWFLAEMESYKRFNNNEVEKGTIEKELVCYDR